MAQPPARALAAVRVICAAAVIAAIVGQLIRSRDSPVFHPANFFSYFTVQSNIIGAAVFLAGAWALLRNGRIPGAIDVARGVSVVCLAATGVVYALVLKETAVQNAFQLGWSDKILHVLFPIAVVADYLLAPPRGRVTWRHVGVWLAFPAAYLVYTMIRGAIVGWYPYPFLDPASHSTAAVIVSCIGVAAFMLAVALLAKALAARGGAGWLRARADEL